MKHSQRQVVWGGPKGGRKERLLMVPQHIRVRSANLLSRRRRARKEVLQLKLFNYGKKDEAKAQVRVVYSDKHVGSNSISRLRAGKVNNVKMILELPRVAYSQDRVPLKVYLNELLIGIEHLRPSPLPPEMIIPVEGLQRPMRPLGGPGPGCLPTIDVWLEPDRDTFFTDETFTLNWRANCAGAVGINWDSGSAAEALTIIEDARRGIYHDHGYWGVIGLPPESSEEIAIGGPGFLIITVYAIGEGARAEQTIKVNLINKPNFSDCGEEREDCILDMVRHIEPLVHQGITLNEDLDTVDVFADGVLDRHEFGLKGEETLERLDRLTFVCQVCTDEQIESGECPGGDYNDGRPNEVNLQFSNRSYPTDYAILHELCHVAGFNSELDPEYSHDEIERMTAEVSGAPFDR